MFKTFIKANVEIVVSLVVALLALTAYFWPIGTTASAKQEEMKETIARKQAALSLKTTIELTGLPPIHDGTYEPNVIQARERELAERKKQAEAVTQLASDQNKEGRVKLMNGRTSHDAGAGREVPLLAKKIPADRLLPQIENSGSEEGDPYTFKRQYEDQPLKWERELNPFAPHSGNPLQDNQWRPTPPTLNYMQKLIEDKNKALLQSAAQVGRFGVSGNTPVLTEAEKVALAKSEISKKASEVNCYVDPDALQKREWFGKDQPPNEQQIFEGIVDSWFQQDVIDAIKAVNNEALHNYTEAADKNVGHSPIKRLVSITVGIPALSTSSNSQVGPLFLGSSGPMVAAGGMSPMGGFGGPGDMSGREPGAIPRFGGSRMPGADPGMPPPPGVMPGPITPAGPSGASGDFTRTLTGHVNTDIFDVVPMRIVLELDPAYQNKFIDALYKTNNGYTVLNINMKAVDPLDAAGHGYLYGPVQCVRVEILVEGLLFRSWTKPLMPVSIRKSLNIADEPAAAPTPGRFPGR